MSSRVLRDGLWSSEAVARLSDGTFRLYVGLISAADDFGLVEVGYGPLKREIFALLDWSRETVSRMLGELIDAGLILPYEHGGKSYAAIAKSSSQVNSKKPRCPLPSWGTHHVKAVWGFKDSATRVAASQYFKHLGLDSGTTSAPPVAHQRPPSGAPVPEGVRVLTRGEKKRDTPRSSKNDRFDPKIWLCPDGVIPSTWNLWLDVRRREKASDAPETYQRCMTKLDSFVAKGHAKQDVIAMCADRCWVDLYEPKNSTAHQHNKAPEQQLLGAFDTTGAFPQGLPVQTYDAVSPNAPQQSSFGSFDTTGKIPPS